MAHRLDDKTLVAGQIGPADVPAFKAEGVTMIINNRPDGEDAGQPTSAEIEAAARAGDTRRNRVAGGDEGSQQNEGAQAAHIVPSLPTSRVLAWPRTSMDTSPSRRWRRRCSPAVPGMWREAAVSPLNLSGWCENCSPGAFRNGR